MLKIFKFYETDVSKEIYEFENKYNIKLPELYKKFILKYNGGNTPKTSFKINGISSDIRVFYGFRNVSKNYNFSLLMGSDYLELFINDNYLPIATDSFGNELVICVDKDNEGKIYFFDRELNKYHHLTDSIDVFFNKVNSKKFVVRSIDERMQGLKDSGSTIKVNDGLINLWQSEIDKYSGRKQEKVIL
ncbi:MAG: SMI1/KNR4 family protein [Acutalibacteraceae bacterium]|nr:SMI1/KNR4 family protein [Acutalibacteraceae bacterium]